jgi:hypothetical protein
MTTALRTMTLVLAATFSLLAAQPARADHDSGYDQIDRLARRIQDESRQLYQELRSASHADYGLRSAVSEVAQVYHLAGRFHSTAHTWGSVRQLHRDAKSLRQLVHHVEEHLAAYRHFRRHIDRIDNLTHDLEDRVLRLDDRPIYSRRPDYGPAHDVRPGISLGGSGFSIRIGR